MNSRSKCGKSRPWDGEFLMLLQLMILEATPLNSINSHLTKGRRPRELAVRHKCERKQPYEYSFFEVFNLGYRPIVICDSGEGAILKMSMIRITRYWCDGDSSARILSGRQSANGINGPAEAPAPMAAPKHPDR
eukprot:scaffold220738_cov38-Prasinocladus_malaysianus.AAC.1